jgi:hypothetical protein
MCVLVFCKSTTTGEDIEVMMCVAGVDLDKPSMKQLRMLAPNGRR